MTSRAAFGKNFFSARHYRDIRGDVSLSTRRIAETERLKPAKKCGDICQALFGRPPENGMLARISNLERFLRREPDQPVVPCQPILRKHSDVYVNANGCAGNTDGIGAVLQNVWHRHLFFFSG